jgi:hypothetical protein
VSVIIKYLVNFTGAGFTVSNDLISGDFLIDVSIRAVMSRGAAGSTFEIKLYDLPESKAEELNQKGKDPKTARVTIKLGYMDGEFDTVMEGVYTDVSATVEGDNLVTTVKGEESGTYALRRKRYQSSFEGKIQFEDAVTKLMKEAFPSGSSDGKEIDQTPVVQSVKKEVEDPSLKGETLMDVLDTLSRKVDAEFFVSDKKVYFGKPITNDRKVDEFDPDRNLAVFQPITRNLHGEEGDNRLTDIPPENSVGFKFIVAGDPFLRPAQKVSAKVDAKSDGKVGGFRKNSGTDFRIHSLVHSLNLTGGYTCEGKAVKPCKENGDNCRRQQDALGLDNPDAIAQKLAQKTRDELTRRPAIEVCAVKQYNAGDASAAPHRATLFFEQRFDKSETQPSVRAEVQQTDEKKIFRNKPMVSPFAWHKCGLVVPVYQGMKALLDHNLNLADDALVTGFIWSEKPTIEPPKSKAGDWWLCLPIDVGSANPPPDSTKAANDLIAGNGKRVIEVRGLKLTVGSDKLKNIGGRPSEGGDDEFLIEHTSGTTIKIADDGSLKIEAKTISVKGDVTIEGNLEIK